MIDPLKTIAGRAWKKIGVKHHHGIQVPLLSLWSQKSFGSGEFLDLIPLIDFLKDVGMDILQLLPLNDSGPDPSPYNALSSTALHPIYLSLHALPNLKTPPNPLHIKTKRLPYRDLLNQKLFFLERYVKTWKRSLMGTKNYQKFIETHPYLHEYALYKVLKKQTASLPQSKWPQTLHHLSKRAKERLLKTHREEMDFHLILQYLCSKQLKEVKRHAKRQGIFLKGDIPILLSPQASDVWIHPELFDLSLGAGSPPNQFDPDGQAWKFPLYRWDIMEKTHFSWWRQRIQSAAEYFDLYRIDHIIGLFRIWAIPHGKSPDQGFFIPHSPHLMEIQGKKLLETLLSFSQMLPIGEDLGDPPPLIREVMETFGIPGINLFRCYRNWETDRSFIPYSQYHPISLSSVSTHDTESVLLWWETFPDEARKYAAFKNWTYTQVLSRKHMKEILYDNHHATSLFHINLLQEYLALVPELTWKNPRDELINVPGTENDFNWTYRYRFPVETLVQSIPLQREVQQVLN